jgi:hypothetical protein
LLWKPWRTLGSWLNWLKGGVKQLPNVCNVFISVFAIFSLSSRSSDQKFAEVQCVWNLEIIFFSYADDKESSSKERLLAIEWTHSLESPQLTKLDKKSNIMKCEL